MNTVDLLESTNKGKSLILMFTLPTVSRYYYAAKKIQNELNMLIFRKMSFNAGLINGYIKWNVHSELQLHVNYEI